jgi:hypothetical protein
MCCQKKVLSTGRKRPIDMIPGRRRVLEDDGQRSGRQKKIPKGLDSPSDPVTSHVVAVAPRSLL